MIKTRLCDDVLELTLDAPPVNALGTATRTGLINAISGAQSNDAVRAIVVRGAGRYFSAGADMSEFGRPPNSPTLPEVAEVIEASAKPVVAAIHGMALGGGLEIALACHYRVATASAKLGLPEVKLGLIPGAGGTQRLPRLVGARAALEMITSGGPVTAGKGEAIGLVDRIIDGSDWELEPLVVARSCARARPTASRAAWIELEVVDAFEAENAPKLKQSEALQASLRAVRAAIELPPGEGFALERELFLQLVEGSQSKALRHVFFAERAAARLQGRLIDQAVRPIRHVGVIGAGTMGGGIAMNFLSVGILVTILDTSQEALDRGVGVIRKNYDASAAKGRITNDEVGRALDLLVPTLRFDELAHCDLIIEAVYENMDLKKQIFTTIDRFAKPGAILASNTSYLDIDEIAAVTRRPEDVVGLHFFSPANVMKLVEVIQGARTGPDVLATALTLARTVKKNPVIAKVCHGFIGNRMLIPRRAQSSALLLEGATPGQIDAVHRAFGMPMGPFQMADLAGTDIGWHRDPTRIENIRDALCAAGRWGQKTKAGYYDYPDGRTGVPSPVTQRIIEKFRSEADLQARDIDEEEIVVRTMYTMVNEAALILEEGIAQRASDIDVVWIYGYGWPARTGGPMFWADSIGLRKIVDGLNLYANRLGTDFKIARLLKRKADAGESFTQS
jgi:3-hydroxyacyl-CoA dehydrogenase